jgi:glycosyltransferase involved in cell wall biosynthesis
VPVFEGVYNRIYHDLSEQWDDPRMGAVLAGVLDAWRPDLVHVQGMQYVGGVSALRGCAERGLPVVMTLHEYWWLCPRGGLMYDVEGTACETATPERCARCVDIYPIDRQRWSDARHASSHASLGERRWFARALEERQAALRAARDLVQRFVAPSRFLLERFVEAGFPRERLIAADYGFPAPARAPAPTVASATRPEPVSASRTRRASGTPQAPLRAGYVGTLSDYKGVEVFAAALERLASRGAVQGHVHGHLDWFPEVAGRLRAVAARCPQALRLEGPFERGDLERILRALDVLVVPSLWWENSPLTIHEAWQRGLPVLTSDRGGMAELAGRGGGALFPPGDDAALAALLRRCAEEKSFLEGLAGSIPPVRPIAEDVRLLERLHAELSG